MSDARHGSVRLALTIAAGIALGFGFLAACWLLARPLTLLFAAIVIGQALAPIVDRLTRRWLPRVAAILVVYAVLLSLLGVLGWLVVPGLVGQGQALIANAPELLDDLQSQWERLNPGGGEQITQTLQGQVAGFSGQIVRLPLTIASSVTEILLVLIMSAYWLVAAPRLHGFVVALVPEDQRDRVVAVLQEAGQTMGGYVRGTAINAVLVGGVTYTGLRLIGVDYPWVLALVAALGELIPIAGPILAAIPAIGVALFDSPQTAVIVLVFYIVIQQLESNVLMPLVMHNQADVPPLLALVAILAGGSIGGLLGAVVAIPLAGALRIIVIRALEPRLSNGAADG